MKNRDNTKRLYLFILNIKLLKKHINKIFFLLLIALLSLNIHELKEVRDKLYNVSVSIYSTTSYPIHWAQSKYYELKSYIIILTSSKDMYLENQRLKEKLQYLELIKTENRDLKQLVNFRDNLTFSKITGRVVLESHESFHNHYLLNIGSQNGIQKGNAIVAQDRLIGRVVDVSSKFSKMQPLTNKTSKIPVSILNTQYWGIASGLNKDGYLKLLYLTDESEIEGGQIVVTSGEGGYIPHGIYVGKTVKKNGGVYVEICPKLNKKLSLVSVLKLKDNFADASTKK